jgi:hypothetical protein
MQSSFQESLATNECVDPQLSVAIAEDTRSEMVNDMTTEEPSSIGKLGGIHAGDIGLIENQNFNSLGFCNWLTSNDLLKEFRKAVSFKVVESSERLKCLAKGPAIDELLSMTASTIIYTGFGAWQRIINGSFRATMAQFFSLIHVAYACAVVVYEGQLESKLQNLLTQSLSLIPETLPMESKYDYKTIASSIWHPSVETAHLCSFTPWEFTTQTQSGHLNTKGQAHVDLYSNEDNELSNVLHLFVDSELYLACYRIPSTDELSSFRRYYIQ